jgi:hypothetical protein
LPGSRKGGKTSRLFGFLQLEQLKPALVFFNACSPSLRPATFFPLILFPKTYQYNFSCFIPSPYICNNVEIKELIATRTYRPSIALFLLALYAFIATPVQWWHHHAAGQQQYAVDGSKSSKPGLWAGKSLSISAEDCQVCAHKYSTSLNDHHRFVQLAITIYPSFETHRPSAYRDALRFDLSNKSPPAFFI